MHLVLLTAALLLIRVIISPEPGDRLISHEIATRGAASGIGTASSVKSLNSDNGQSGPRLPII